MNKLKLYFIKKSFFISLAYVGLGTISVLSSYPSSPLYGNWVIFTIFITLPVNFISVGVMIADSTAFGFVLIIQLFYFLIFWLIVYYILKGRSKKVNID
jgi:hypothetical protein